MRYVLRGQGHLRARADLVESEFLALLDRLHPNQDRIRLIEEIFRRVWKDKQTTAQLEAGQLATNLKRLEERKDRILEQMADGVLHKEDFEDTYRDVKARIQETRGHLMQAEHNVIDVDTALSYVMHLFWNSRNLWEESDLGAKQRLAKLIFPKGIIFSKRSFGTPLTHSIYTLLADERVEEREVVRPERFELPTFWFVARRSIQLS